MSNYRRKATYKLMGQSIVSDGTRMEIVPGQIKSLMRSRLGVECSYWKARRARDFACDALYDTDEENCHEMSSYLYMLEQEMSTRCSSVFSVDGSFLKGKFRRTLSFATAQDANHKIYPVAFTIVDGENDSLWSFFFRQMKRVVPDSSDLVWVSDRHMSIAKNI